MRTTLEIPVPAADEDETPEGRCKRCGNEALRDVVCSECSTPVVAAIDEGGLEERPDGTFVIPDLTGHGHDEELQCSECKSKKLTVEYWEYCSWCEHMLSKDD
jgi:hypothetical protein